MLCGWRGQLIAGLHRAQVVKSIERICGTPFELDNFTVQAVTDRSVSLGRVTVRIQPVGASPRALFLHGTAATQLGDYNETNGSSPPLRRAFSFLIRATLRLVFD